MVEKVNGYFAGGEHLTGNMDFFTLRTTLNIKPNGVVAPVEMVTLPYTDINGTTYNDEGSYNSAKVVQDRFDKLIQTIATKAQPIILGGVTSASETGPVADIPAASVTGDPYTVYTLKFAIEHTEAWATGDDIEAALNGIANFVSTSPTTNNNVAVVRNATL